MLNVQQISSTLRGMSDQQLAQYAAMHKADPYIFPLAFQESQDRKSMRAGKLAQMAGQKPPPVVDQDLQQMMPQPAGIPLSAPNAPTGVPMQGPGSPAQSLPEDQGIGALPAKNLQGMKDGGITGQHFKDKGEVYKTISDEDIKAITSANQPMTAQELATARSSLVAPMNAEMETAYKPFTEKLAQREQELAGRKESNVGNALLAAGLRMMAGTSPYAFQNIGAGGIEGLQTYSAAQKADQAAKDALDHSNMLLMQAQRAERSGNSRDATMLLEAAQKQKDAQVAHGLTGLQLKNTSQFQAGQLANTELQRQIEAAKLEELRQHHKDLLENYYKPLGAAQTAKAGAALSPEDIQRNKVDAIINAMPAVKSIAARLKDPLMEINSPEYNEAMKQLYNITVGKYKEHNIKDLPDIKDFVSGEATTKKKDPSWWKQHAPEFMGGLPSGPPPATPGVKFLNFEE